MKAAFAVLIAKPEYGGRYWSLTPGHEDFADAAQYKELVDAHIMFKDMAADSYLVSAGIASDWPHGRGCYVSEDKGFIIWVGEEDHLRIMCMQKGTMLNQVFDRWVLVQIENVSYANNHCENFSFVLVSTYWALIRLHRLRSAVL
jgi:creatine kinase